jgi:hypothetical protein
MSPRYVPSGWLLEDISAPASEGSAGRSRGVAEFAEELLGALMVVWGL